MQHAQACTGQLHFLKTTGEGVSSVQLIYYLRLKNTGHRACVARHFLMIDVPRKTGAPIYVQARVTGDVGGDLGRIVNLTRPLIVQPGKTVEATALLDTPCGHIVGTNVAVKIVVVADEWPVYAKTSIAAEVCPSEPNEVELWPLAHV